MGKSADSTTSNPTHEIYVYRYEDRRFLERWVSTPPKFTLDRVPTIYHINLRDPAGMLLASPSR